MKFEDLKLKGYIQNAINDLHFKEMTKVQKEVIPQMLEGKNIIGQSQTGSGKTHAFLLPIFERLDETLNEVQVLIIAPTRELSEQIYEFASHIASFYDGEIDIRNYTGGQNRDREVERLMKSQPQIVIGTPGKIRDLVIKENVLKIFTAKYFIIDEADMSLDDGFLEEVDNFAGTMANDLNMSVFSATIPEKLKPFLNKYMNNPVTIHIDPRELAALQIEHTLIHTKYKEKEELLLKTLEVINPFLALIFTNTKQKAGEVAAFLRGQGYKVGEIHGGLDSRERRRVMKRIRDLDYQYIVASDIAARGIDIPGVSHIINFELPKDIEFYVHRSGRTARADMDGIVISFYDLEDDSYLDKLEDKGIRFVFKTIQNKEFVKAKMRKARAKREYKEDDIERQASLKVRKAKKVKPGYKKKYKSQMEQEKQKLKRKSNKKRR